MYLGEFLVFSSILFMSKVIVGLSGGVDSSVSCALLLEQGYSVEAAFMKNWVPRSPGEGLLICPLIADEKDARLVASKLKINLSVLSFENEYRDQVVDYLFAEYAVGRTPNPDVLCNSKIKFKAFLVHVLEWGADFVATGHYVRKGEKEINGKKIFTLLKAIDGSKDQSYFLHQLKQEQLARCLFPLGEILKTEVRVKAKELGLATAIKKDSQGICFVGEVAIKEFLKERLAQKTGDIITVDGQKIGEHDGAWYYTIGQRRGLGVGGGGIPYYLVDKDIEKNILIVARGDKDDALFSSGLVMGEVNWIAGFAPLDLAKEFTAKIRYRQADQACHLQQINSKEWQLNFKEKQRAVTPGQFAVIYDGDECLGGGVILRAIK